MKSDILSKITVKRKDNPKEYTKQYNREFMRAKRKELGVDVYEENKSNWANNGRGDRKAQAKSRSERLTDSFIADLLSRKYKMPYTALVANKKILEAERQIIKIKRHEKRSKA
jgi:hypothetical protein